jgi:hypothetical protein
MRNFSGDINAQVDMMAFVKGADLIKRTTGATVLILHHPGLKEVNRPAGSRSLAGAVDGMARLFELDGKRVFKLVKLRDGDVNKPPVSYVLKSVEVDFSFDGPDLTSAFLNAADQPTSDSDDSILMQIHQSKPRSQTDIRVEGIKTKSAMQRRIDKLRKAGMIVVDKLALTPKGAERVRNIFPDDGISDGDGTMD